MYSNKVENDGKCFEIPAILSCKRETTADNHSDNGASRNFFRNT